MQKLNVLHLNASTRLGGTETMILRFLSAADKSKFDFFVVAFFPGGSLLNYAEKQGAKTALFKITKQYNVFQLISAFIKLYSYLKQNKIDILHIYGFWTNIFGRTAAKLVKTPVIITGQRTEDNWRKWYHSVLDRITSQWVDLYISVFNKGRELLIKRDRILAEKIIVINNGIDLDWAISGRGNGKTLIIGMVASFSSFKAHEQLILAAPQIIEKFPQVKFILAGDGRKKKEVTALIEELKLNPYFILTGFVADVRPILAMLSVFVLVTHSEGLPVSIIEAMSFGLPVIASNVGGIPELITDGINGILINQDNHNQLASAIIDLLDSPDKRMLIGDKAREKIAHDFSIQKMTKKIQPHYINLAKKKGLV